MSKGHRTERVGEEIRKIISDMLLKDIKDPRLEGRMISITAVEVSDDLGYAHVYLDILTGKNVSDEEREAVQEDVLAGFDSCSGHIRKELSKKLRVRHAPELSFRIDKSMEYGSHIDEMLKNLGL
jgi:ribosome-binding factor A